jgi:hypothetical protein
MTGGIDLDGPRSQRLQIEAGFSRKWRWWLQASKPASASLKAS